MNKFKNIIRLIRSYLYDMKRYYRFSCIKTKTPETLLTKITTCYHVLEKGLSFRDIRVGFGKEKIEEIVQLLNLYMKVNGDVNNSQIIAASKVLEGYNEYHERISDQLDSEIIDRVANIKKTLSSIYKLINNEYVEYLGGCKEIIRSEYLHSSKGDFASLSKSRCSIRDFSTGDVPLQEIQDSVVLASKSPSTCNRQSARVHCFCNEQDIQRILDLHKGARGFSSYVNKLLIVAGDLKACVGVGDRSQVYLDCGIFTMSLLYALQYRGIGACILHWNVDLKKDKNLRSLIEIPSSHTIVCMIAVGMLNEKFNVPISQRKPIEEIVSIY
ncbi:MAG: nitroreductase family protein [Syntrophotaleaceae bacterium]